MGVGKPMSRLTSDQPLKYGYTLSIIDELTSAAVHNERFYQSRDHTERMELAWSAIVEHLYASEEPPTRHELLFAGMSGIGRHFKEEQRHHGIPQDRSRYDFGVNFERYWETFGRPTPSPENRIVERVALEQIWSALTPTARSTFTALAAWDDYELAAKSVDRTRGQFYSQVSYSRRVFLELWHDGETPSRPWGHDVRRTKRAVTPRSTAKIIRNRQRKTQAAGPVQAPTYPKENSGADRSHP
jgi:hypothetical protein